MRSSLLDLTSIGGTFTTFYRQHLQRGVWNEICRLRASCPAFASLIGHQFVSGTKRACQIQVATGSSGISGLDWFYGSLVMSFPYFSSYFSAHVLLARYPRRIATSPLSARSMNWGAPPSCCGSSRAIWSHSWTLRPIKRPSLAVCLLNEWHSAAGRYQGVRASYYHIEQAAKLTAKN